MLSHRIPKPLPVYSMAVVGILCLTGLLFVPVDMYIASRVSLEHLPGDVRATLQRAEVFGHGSGVAAIIITFWCVARPRLRSVATLIGCSFGAGLAADLIKLFVWRLRPADALAQSAEFSFEGIAPWLLNGRPAEALERMHHSFPSAHTATAMGLAVGLGHFYPKGRTWFFFLASLVALQRVASRAHYVSDTLFGTALGMMVAWGVLSFMTARTAVADHTPVNVKASAEASVADEAPADEVRHAA